LLYFVRYRDKVVGVFVRFRAPSLTLTLTPSNLTNPLTILETSTTLIFCGPTGAWHPPTTFSETRHDHLSPCSHQIFQSQVRHPPGFLSSNGTGWIRELYESGELAEWCIENDI
jgi:hypothetical protein